MGGGTEGVREENLGGAIVWGSVEGGDAGGEGAVYYGGCGERVWGVVVLVVEGRGAQYEGGEDCGEGMLGRHCWGGDSRERGDGGCEWAVRIDRLWPPHNLIGFDSIIILYTRYPQATKKSKPVGIEEVSIRGIVI